MSWYENIGKSLADMAIKLGTPSYPENGTAEEINAYYDKLYQSADRGVDFAGMLGIDVYDYHGEHSHDVIHENLNPDSKSWLPDLKLLGNPELFVHYLEGEGTPITLDVPNRYGEIVGQYHCHSIVKSGEKAICEFVDIICNCCKSKNFEEAKNIMKEGKD